jgi:hypothetical protein
MVALVHKHAAAAGSIVTESKMIPDSLTGEDREIDVYIEGNITDTGNHAKAGSNSRRIPPRPHNPHTRRDPPWNHAGVMEARIGRGDGQARGPLRGVPYGRA